MPPPPALVFPLFRSQACTAFLEGRGGPSLNLGSAMDFPSGTRGGPRCRLLYGGAGRMHPPHRQTSQAKPIQAKPIQSKPSSDRGNRPAASHDRAQLLRFSPRAPRPDLHAPPARARSPGAGSASWTQEATRKTVLSKKCGGKRKRRKYRVPVADTPRRVNRNEVVPARVCERWGR